MVNNKNRRNMSDVLKYYRVFSCRFDKRHMSKVVSFSGQIPAKDENPWTILHTQGTASSPSFYILLLHNCEHKHYMQGFSYVYVENLQQKWLLYVLALLVFWCNSIYYYEIKKMTSRFVLPIVIHRKSSTN